MIAIEAAYKSFRSLADGGFVLSFDTHEGMVDQLARISKLKGEPLYVVVMTESQFNQNKQVLLNG